MWGWAVADCFKQVKAQLKKRKIEVDDKALRQVIEEIEALKDGPKYRGKAKEFRDRNKKLSAQARRERAQNLLKTKNRLEIYKQDAFKGKPLDAMLALFEGADFQANLGRLSVGARQQALLYKFQNNLAYGLEEAGVYNLVKKGLIDKEIMQELYELRDGGKIGISGSTEAKQAAQVIRKVQQQMLTEMRSAGIDIGEIPGYIMSQTHNREKVNPNVLDQKADFEAWFAEIMPKLDERTFEGVKDKTEFMQAIFDDIASGRRDRAINEDVSDQLITVVKGGAPNLSKKLGKSRTLHFKDGASFYEYNQKFGSKDLMQSIVSTMDKTARSVGLVQMFGTNPRAAVEADFKRLKMDESSAKKVRRALDEAEGLTKVPGRSLAAKAVKNVRIIQSMAKLGGAALAGLTDTAITGASIRSATGKNYLEALNLGIQEFGKNLNKTEKKRFLKAISYATDDLLGGMYNRFSLDNGPGMMSKAQDMYFRLNGVELQASTARTAAASAVSRIYAEELTALKWDALPGEARGSLSAYGIDAKNWDVARRGVEEIDGRKMWTPEALENLDIPDKQKQELSMRMAAFLSNVAESGSPVPGPKQRRQLLMGQDPDSGLGLALSLITQFKSFPLAMHSIVKRQLLNNPDFKESSLFQALKTGQFDKQNLAGMMVFGMGFAYLGMTARSLLEGKEPPDATSGKTWTEAFVRSGTAGLFGDFLFGEYDKTYRSFLKDALGPSLGQLDDVAELYATARNGDPKAGKALRLLKNNLPGQNLFYTKAAMDYLVWWRINETLNPGYLRRLKKRAREENQDYLFFDPGSVR